MEVISLAEPTTAQYNLVWRMYRERKREWNLTREQFDTLITSPCHYCGIPFSNCIHPGSKKAKPFHYNGIDRKDSSKGYVEGNVVPCCKICNLAKRDMPYASFISYLDRLVLFRRIS